MVKEMYISRKRCYKCYIVDCQTFNLLHKVLQNGFKCYIVALQRLKVLHYR